MNALEFLEADDKPAPTPEPRPTPVTYYSLGKSIGGADETEDQWTNQGYSSKGKNLTPGVAAVNDAVYPLGSVLKDRETGQVFLATDRHGNKDPNVVDLYVPPSQYQKVKVVREFDVVGKVPKIPTTAEGVREVLAPFGTVPEGETAEESLARMKGGEVKPTKLSQDEEQRFEKWYSSYAAATGNDKNPDAESHRYDYRGYWKEQGDVKVAEGMHLPDTYKLPGHPTFSKESKFAVGPYADQAGTWDGETFIPPAKKSAAEFLNETTPQAAKDLLDEHWWIDDGKLMLDPKNYRKGLDQAREAGLIEGEDYTRLEKDAAEIEKAAAERQKLVDEAGENDAMKAVLYGLGRGGSMTLGGLGGAGAGTVAAPFFGPAAPVVPIVTGVAGAVAGSMAYDAAYKKLGEWNKNYASVLAAKKLNPGYTMAGEMAFVALDLPVSAMNMVKAVRTVAAAKGGTEAAKFAGKAMATGAATGVAADTGMRVTQRALGDEEVAAPSGETVLGAATMGMLASGLFVGGKRYTLKDLYGIAEKQAKGVKLSSAEAEAMNQAAEAVRMTRAEMPDKPVTNVEVKQATQMGKTATTQPVVTVGEPGRGALPNSGGEGGSGPGGRIDMRKLEGGTAQEQFEALARKAGQDVDNAPVIPATEAAAPVPGSGGTRPAPMTAEEFLATEDDVDPFALDDEGGEGVTDYVPGGDEEAIAQARANAEIEAQHQREMQAEIADLMRGVREEAGSVELLSAIEAAGGLPARGNQYEQPYRGELDMVRESAKANTKMKLFRKDAPDPDALVTSLRDKGFAIEGPNQLWDLLDARLRNGTEHWSEPAQLDSYWQERQGMAMREDAPGRGGAIQMATPEAWRNWLRSVKTDSRFSKPAEFPTTPPVLQAVGLPNLPLAMLPHSAAKVMGNTSERKHAVTEEQMVQLPHEIGNPVAVFASADPQFPDSLVVLTSLAENGKPVIVAIHPDRQMQNHKVNVIASAYGKDRWQKIFNEWAGKGLLRYANQKKENPWMRSAELQLLMEASKGGKKVLTEGDFVKPAPASDHFTPAETNARASQAIDQIGQRPVGTVSRELARAERAEVPDIMKQEKLLALGFRREMLNRGQIQFVGREIRSVYELALAGQVYRDPRIETMRWVLTRNGKVVDTLGVTSRNPRYTEVTLPGQTMGNLIDWARRAAADSVWLLHNHPSGDPTPSQRDKTLTEQIAGALTQGGLEFGGHVVIDGKEFYHIGPDGAAVREDLPVGEDAILKPEWEYELLNMPMRNNKNIALAAKTYAQLAADQRGGEGQVTMFLMDTKRHVRAVTTIPVELFVDRKRLPIYLRTRGADYGVSFAVAYYDHSLHQQHVADAMAEYVRGSVLDDGLLSPEMQIFPDRGGESYFGESLDNLGAGEAVREEAAELEAAGGRLADEAVTEGPLRVIYADSRGTFATVPLTGLKDIKIIEMPEMIQLAKELTGSSPEVRRMRAAMGKFIGNGSGQIFLDPRIFADSIVTAKVLAHEIGHLVDYLPHHHLKRGNIIGRLYSLRNHLQRTAFGSKTGLNEQKVRDELVELTQYWRPWDEATSPAWFNSYRKSSIELYADAVSVLFNSPATLKEKAPTFYREFFAWLDKKPEVKKEFFELQAQLHRPVMELLRARSGAVQTMFGKAEEIFLRAREKRKQQRMTARGFLDQLKEQFYDKYNPIIQRQRTLEKAGTTVPADLRMDWLFDEHPMADNLTYTWLSRVWKRVVQPLEAKEITLEDLGEYLFFNRLMADRSNLANPLGHTPATAKSAIFRMRLDMGIEKFTVLEHGAKLFHDYVFETVKEATEAGLISQETFKTVIEPNRGTYAAFRPIDYVEDYVPAGVFQQVGTLKEVENPWLTTILKTVAMRRAIQYQKAKVGTVGFLTSFFPGEIRAAEMRFDGKRNVPLPLKDREKALLEVRADGKWTAYEVPADIGRMFERIDPAQANAAIRALDWVFRRGFYNVWVRFNPVFQFLYSPVRDAQRFYTNMPKAGVFKLAAEYLKAVPAAYRRLIGTDDPIVTEMYENLAMSTPHDSYGRNGARDDAFESILQQFHLVNEDTKGKWSEKPVIKQAAQLLRGIEFGGQILEATPKIAAFKILTRDLGWNRRDAASYIRNYVGVPNYMRKGRHAYAAGAMLPFWNVAIQGLASDAALATGKEKNKSKASWWLRWALAGGMYSILQALAREGVMGDDAKEWFSGVSDYDNTNFIIVPLGTSPGGDYGKKVVYLRIPQDEAHRLTNGLVKKFIEVIGNHANDEAVKPVMNDLMQLLSFSGGQLPGANPIIGLGGKWKEYSDGLNPYDSFRGRHVLSNAEFLAGGWASFKPMLAMTWNEAGLGNFYRVNTKADSTTELVLSNLPLAQRLVKVSDRGYSERQQAGIDQDAALNARLKLSMPKAVQQLATEHNFLRSLGKNKTPEQTVRYQQLREWYKRIYTPAVESAEGARDVGLPVRFDGQEAASKPWE